MNSLSTLAFPRSTSSTRSASAPIRRRPENERRDHGDGGESDVRPELIHRARARMEAGVYDHPLAAHLVADKLARLLAS